MMLRFQNEAMRECRHNVTLAKIERAVSTDRNVHDPWVKQHF